MSDHIPMIHRDAALPVLSRNSIASFHQRFPDRSPAVLDPPDRAIARIMGRMALIFWSTAAHTIGMWLRHTAEPKFTQVAQLEEALHLGAPSVG